jgi:thiol-disulfide isomerase/thioredoxin
MLIKYFSASWCVTCKAQYPIWQMYAAKYGHELKYIDIEQEPLHAQSYAISGLPTTVFEDGRRFPGAQMTSNIDKACAVIGGKV